MMLAPFFSLLTFCWMISWLVWLLLYPAKRLVKLPWAILIVTVMVCSFLVYLATQ